MRQEQTFLLEELESVLHAATTAGSIVWRWRPSETATGRYCGTYSLAVVDFDIALVNSSELTVLNRRTGEAAVVTWSFDVLAAAIDKQIISRDYPTTDPYKHYYVIDRFIRAAEGNTQEEQS